MDAPSLRGLMRPLLLLAFLFGLVLQAGFGCKTYFKLGYDKAQPVLVYDRLRAEQDFQSEHITYHIEFFRAGLNAIIQQWLAGGCKESPATMADIIKAEYRGR